VTAAERVEAQQAKYRAEIANKEASIDTKKSAMISATEQLEDYKKMLTSMNEARARFVKECDAKSLTEIKKVMNGGQGTPGARATAQEILDLICKFIKKNPQSSYAVDGADVFSSAEAFNSAVKRCDPSAQEKAWISEVANKVNMDMDGKKGALLQAICNGLEQ